MDVNYTENIGNNVARSSHPSHWTCAWCIIFHSWVICATIYVDNIYNVYMWINTSTYLFIWSSGVHLMGKRTVTWDHVVGYDQIIYGNSLTCLVDQNMWLLFWHRSFTLVFVGKNKYIIILLKILLILSVCKINKFGLIRILISY